jgi:hypothetical protein
MECRVTGPTASVRPNAQWCGAAAGLANKIVAAKAFAPVRESALTEDREPPDGDLHLPGSDNDGFRPSWLRKSNCSGLVVRHGAVSAIAV